MKTTKSFLPRSLFATAFATVALAALLLMPLTGALAANKYYKSTTANSWTGSFWGNASGGPYTTAWASGSDVFFDDNSGTTSLITGASTAFSSITANENVTVTASGTLATGGTVASVTVASGKTLNFQAQSLSTAAGTGFIKNGPGTWSLANANAYLGGFTLNAGTVAVGGVNAMGAGGTLTINAGTIRSTSATARDLTGKYTSITVGGDFTLGDAVNTGALTFTAPIGLGAANRIITVNSGVAFGGAIGGSAGVGFTKSGAGTLTLSGANTFTGPIAVNVGQLSIAGAGYPALGGNNPGVNGPSSITVESGATLSFTITGTGFHTTNYYQPLTLNGGTVQIAGGSGANQLAPLVLNGGLTLGANSTIVNNGNSSYSIPNTTTVNLGGNTLTFQADGSLPSSIAAPISGSGGSIVKSGASTLTLSASAGNTFSGNTIISAGTLSLGNVNAIQNTTGITIGGAAAAVLSTSTDGITIGVPITTANSGTNSTISFGRGTANVGTLTLNGAIGGNGNVIFSTPNASSGGNVQTVILGAAGTYGGTTTITTGNINNTTIIRAGVANALPTNTVLTLSPGLGAGGGRTTTFDLNGNNQTLAGLASIAVMPDLRSIRVSSTAAATLTINGTTANTYGGTGPSGQTATITGAISLVKNGSGTQTLTGAANSFTGSTTILGGTLALSGIGSIANTPSIAVGTGATFDVSALTSAFTLGAAQTLSGNGTVTGSVTNDGTIAAGASTGTLTFGSAPTLNGGGAIVAEINRNGGSPLADKLVISSGTLTFGGTLTVTNIGAALQIGDTFDILDGTLSGSFSTVNLPNGASHWMTSDLNVGGTITFTNSSPVATNLTVGVVHGGTVVLPVIGGKNSATDAEGDSITVTAVSTPGSGSASFGASNVTYTADGTTGTNTFTYTVTDALGATDTKTVTVIVGNPQGFNQVSAGVDGGNAVLQYLGIPGTNYALEITHDLPATNWVPVITNPASASGYLYFTNPISLSPTNDYYRTRYAP